ncbi:HD domain-containing protein [Peribacillus kribbensis]|uniref:HD domain-containing protein n=1 Tax=Peribacillus kribbensis TaxID=356658 RepID=UPI000417D954|nr:HD domain-containing protein [Peribacillus kribbensis]
MDSGSDLITEARDFSLQAHKGQIRKLGSLPYFQHPENVAQILKEAGFRDEVIAAAYLHDVVEDTAFSSGDIALKFGPEVAALVAGNTENKTQSWEERKSHTIRYARTASLEVKALIAADKLDNLRSILEGYNIQGAAVWNFFKRGKDKQAWYYSEAAAAVLENLGEPDIPPFFYELSRLAADLKK